MRVIASAAIIIILNFLVFSQNSPVESSKEETEISTRSGPEKVQTDTIPPRSQLKATTSEKTGSDSLETAKSQEKSTGSDTTAGPAEENGFVNPFISSDEHEKTTVKESADSGDIPDAVDGEEDTGKTEENTFNETGGGLDVLIDLAVGVSLPRFTVEPDYITTEGKPNITFSAGVALPFAKNFYAHVAVKYLQLSCHKSAYDTTDAAYPFIYSELKTKELTSFLSIPVKVGMQFETGMITPYFYGDIEPAYLLSGGQFIRENIVTVFDAAGNQLSEEYEQNINITELRQRYQVFVGGGAGCLVYYGYGYVYVDVACQYAIRETGTTRDLQQGRPRQTSGRMLYFPVALGIRFFL